MPRRAMSKGGRGVWLVRALAVAAAAFLVLTAVQAKLGLSLGLPDLKALSELIRGASSELVPTSGDQSDGDLTVKVHFIDVGQGKSILIQTSEQNVLIDAGEAEQGPIVLGYLNELRVERLDIVIASHPHSDHIGGLEDVLSQIDADLVLMPELSGEMTPTSTIYRDLLEIIAEKGIKVNRAEPGELYELGGGAELTLLGPLDRYDDLNDYSVVSRLDFGANSFLFAGDAASAAEDDLLNAGAELKATVLDVGHHGSRTSTSEDFILEVNPRVAVISCGADNSYGHPHRDVLERLEALGAEMLRTDQNGTIVITSDGEKLGIEVEK